METGMKKAFRLVCSEGASFLTKGERDKLVKDAVKRVEQIEPKEAAYIFSDDRGLKVVVRWSKLEVWIMSNEEAVNGGLPSVSDN
jgi:hypothetical protein